MYIRETLRILDNYGMPKADLDKVYYKNLETDHRQEVRLTGGRRRRHGRA